MNDVITNFFRRLGKRIAPFFDLTAWVLLIVCLIPLLIIDRPMLLTLLQWTAFGLALAANTVVVARLFLPQVDLSEWVAEARKGSVAAAIVVAAVAFLLSALFLGLVLWAKA
ncbi:MAG: hypothetical protein RBT55_03625 [Rhodocyclaceae bacterium]|jgi:hypothetical protein|nr:hypothetical protein [Rhodocyclaceae bacterium]